MEVISNFTYWERINRSEYSHLLISPLHPDLATRDKSECLDLEPFRLIINSIRRLCLRSFIILALIDQIDYLQHDLNGFLLNYDPHKWFVLNWLSLISIILKYKKFEVEILQPYNSAPLAYLHEVHPEFRLL